MEEKNEISLEMQSSLASLIMDFCEANGLDYSDSFHKVKIEIDIKKHTNSGDDPIYEFTAPVFSINKITFNY